MSLVVNNVSLSFQNHQILNDISLAIADQEFVGIIGPNGSGKSTLLKCIYRVLQADSGEIRIDDSLLSQMRYKDSAKKLAVVSQHHHYQFDFTVEDIVKMGRTPHQKLLDKETTEDQTIVRHALEKVSMNHLSKRLFSTLSGGEQQRVILARALAQQTPYLILDEPTNHLDIKYQIGLLKIVKQEKVTTFAALHDLNLAAMYCDKLYVLNHKKIVAYGKPQDVLTPALIQEVYAVQTEVVTDGNGQMHILFTND